MRRSKRRALFHDLIGESEQGRRPALKLLPVLRPIRVATANLCSWCEQPFARNMINLQPRAVRILEQHRVVAGGKIVVSRFVNDMCADFYKEVMRLVDIGTFSRTKTVVV